MRRRLLAVLSVCQSVVALAISGLLPVALASVTLPAALLPIAPVSAYKASDVMTDVDSEQTDFAITGRIVDQKQKAIAAVKVLLWEANGDLSMEAASNAAGEFKFLHKPCGKLCLQILPEANLKLASALVENLPGEETRKILIELKSGFVITGRVVHNKKGLKGLIIRVKPNSPKDTRTRVHGGGVAETAKNGSFSIVLTGGDKKLAVINDNYPELSKRLDKTFTVTEDANLGAIDLQ